MSRCLLLLLLPLTFLAHAAEPPAATGLDAQQARQAVALLQDPQKRDELILALQAIASQAGTTPATSASAATTQTSATPAATPAASQQTTTLEADGLIAQTLRRMGRWADHLGAEIGQMQRVVSDLPAWSRASFDSEEGRRGLLNALWLLGVVFLTGLAVEWLAYRLLANPRRTLQAHADAADQQALAEAQRRQQEASSPPPAAPPEEDAGTRPAESAVALVQTQRDGVERLEAVPIAADDGAAPPTEAPPTPTTTATDAQARAATASVEEHWSTLRHLPFALGFLVLELLPLAAFWIAAALLAHLLTADDARQATLVGNFLGAYLTTRATLIGLRLLMDPAAHGVRLLKVRAGLAHTLLFWLHGFVALVTFGLALAEAAHILGAGESGREAIVKLVSLLAHLVIVALIIRIRRPVAARIAAPAQHSGALAALRNWLAQVWAPFAVVLVLGAWTMWALDIEDGLPRLMNFVALTAGILVLGRLAAIFLLGLLGRAFQPRPGADGQPAGPSRLHRYYPLARWLVGIAITLATALALFQAWGWQTQEWFAVGSIGRNLASAFLTILIAAVLAMVVWEGANALVERRLTLWHDQGDTVRAARLRTLLPMLRTCLFIVIALIVGLTALSEIGINTTPLLAGASIIGVALGFGSQKLVQDFITGIFLLLENAMQVGDWVTVAGVSGTVEYLSIRTVRLRAGDGSLHIVPFSSVSAVNNINRGIGNAALKVSVGYEEDVERVIGELKAIGTSLREDPAYRELILADLEVWGVDAVDGAMVTLTGQIRCLDKGRWGVQRELNRRILEHFRACGIAIANPRASLLLSADPGVVPSAPIQPRTERS